MSAFVSFVNGLRGALNLIGNFRTRGQRCVPDAEISAPTTDRRAIYGNLLRILGMPMPGGPFSTVGSSMGKSLEHDGNPLVRIVTDLSLEQNHLLRGRGQVFTRRHSDRFIAQEMLRSELGKGLTIQEDQGYREE